MEYALEQGAARGKHIHFSVNTNGTIFSEEVDELLRKYRVTISISMDGTREAHDTYRVFRSGRGSYDTVVQNVPKFLAIDPYAMVNATLTADNVDLFEYAVHFRSLGFQIIRFAIVGTAVPGVAVRREELLDRIRTNYDRLAEYYADDLRHGHIWYLSDFYKYFENLRFLHPRMNRCGAGTSYVNIDVNGKVHLCHRFTADKTQEIGDVSNGLDQLAVPHEIRRMNQLLPMNGSVPSGVQPSPVPSRGNSVSVALPVIGQVSGASSCGSHVSRPHAEDPLTAVHRRLDGEVMLEQRGSLAGGNNPCSICDIRFLCGGMCFHDGEILHGDLFGGPDVFKCEVDRHLAKIAIWLVDQIHALDDGVFAELDRLHQCSAQRTKGKEH